MTSKAVRTAVVGALCAAVSAGAFVPLAEAAAPQTRAIAWEYHPDEHRIAINDKTLFTTELCAGSDYVARCVRIATQCADRFREVGGGWVTAMDSRGRRICPQTGGLPGTELRQSMSEVVTYWNALT